MASRLRLVAALSAVVTAVMLAWQTAAPGETGVDRVQLRSTAVPMTVPMTVLTTVPSTTMKSPILNLTNPRPFDPCEDIPLGAVQGLGLTFTPPEHEEGLRCQYDAGNYQVAVEAIIWRSYAESLPADAVELTINGHRAAQYWVMKPTDWNRRWWYSCMVVFQTSYGLIQQSLYFSPIYANPMVDCPSENLMRAQQLSPYYIF